MDRSTTENGNRVSSTATDFTCGLIRPPIQGFSNKDSNMEKENTQVKMAKFSKVSGRTENAMAKAAYGSRIK